MHCTLLAIFCIFADDNQMVFLQMQQPTPIACSSCDSKGHVECQWCSGTGFFILGDNMLCQVPSRNTTCVICTGKVKTDQWGYYIPMQHILWLLPNLFLQYQTASPWEMSYICYFSIFFLGFFMLFWLQRNRLSRKVARRTSDFQVG